MLANNPLFLVNFCFFQLTLFYFCKAVCVAENTIEIVFSAEHSFCASQIAKPPFEGPSQNGPFETKSAILGFPCACWSPYFCSVWWFGMVTKESAIFPKQIVATKMRVLLYLPNTNSVCRFFKQCHFRKKIVHNHPKTLFFSFFVEISFSKFFIFLFFFFQHKKTKSRSALFFWKKKNFFYTLTNCPKNIFAHLHTICDFSDVRGKQAKQNLFWPSFWPSPGPSFDSKNPNLGPSFFDSTTHIHIHIHAYMRTYIHTYIHSYIHSYRCCEVRFWPILTWGVLMVRLWSNCLKLFVFFQIPWVLQVSFFYFEREIIY